MKLFVVVGARPNFIKIVSIIEALSNQKINYKLIHTGQHYDFKMSEVFFDELKIPKPDINLEVDSASHAVQTSEIMQKFEKLCLEERPDIILVVGDVNSTLACALVASKLHIKISHIESGLRSFNKKMPEEVNRVLTDHVSDYLFCPTERSVENLKRENITKKVYLVGDTMYDIFLKITNSKETLFVPNLVKPYSLVTLHRQENVDNKEKLKSIIKALNHIAEDNCLVFPIHPRTQKQLSKFKIAVSSKVMIIKPVGYLYMLKLETDASVILTDSGGVQKEAYFSRVPCVTLREETEWVETIEAGWNRLVGSNTKSIVNTYIEAKSQDILPYLKLYGDGNAGERIVSILREEKM